MDISEQLESFESVKYRMKAEGVDYCFIHYSSFEDVKDEQFHKLRLAYIKASEDIQAYVNTKIEELQNAEEE